MNALPATAESEESFEREACDAAETLLLQVQPLIRIVRGDKRSALEAAWLRLAGVNMRRRLQQFHGTVPTSRRGVLLALHRAVVDLCQVNGIGGVDLTEAYNGLVDDPTFKVGQGDEQAKLKALFAVLIVEGYVQ